ENDNLMSRMLLRRAARPHWWLEGSSYPIRILNRNRVEVLAHSEEMRIRYGAAPVVVRFRWEDGEVIHVVSHFYRQLDARGPQVATGKALDSYQGLTEKDKKELKAAPAAAAPAADVESSYAFQRMTANLVTGKQRRNKELEDSYNMAVKGAPRLRTRVLEKKDGQARVRDEEG